MRPSLRIRTAQPGDANRIAILAAQVWLHTYANEGINEDVAQYVLSEFIPEKFLQSMRDPGTHFLVAEHNEKLVGLTVVKLDSSCPSGASSSNELKTLYVQEHYIGQGIGRALLQAAEATATERSKSPLWLMVNAKNAREGLHKSGSTLIVDSG